ncbi:Microtubule-associated protein 6, partial [Chaetura pelagica]
GTPRPGPAPHPSPPADSVMRHDYKAWKVQRPEPSCKPKSEYQPSHTPFEKETQYQKDFRAWPIPKRGDHPWIPKPGPEHISAFNEWLLLLSWCLHLKGPCSPLPICSACGEAPAALGACLQAVLLKLQNRSPETHSNHCDLVILCVPCWDGLALGGQELVVSSSSFSQSFQEQQDRVGGSSQESLPSRVRVFMKTPTLNARNEFRPWVDVKPVKAIKAKPQYKPPEEKMTHETSYSAQFKGETSKPSPADNKFLERRRIRTLYSEPYKEPPKV